VIDGHGWVCLIKDNPARIVADHRDIGFCQRKAAAHRVCRMRAECDSEGILFDAKHHCPPRKIDHLTESRHGEGNESECTIFMHVDHQAAAVLFNRGWVGSGHCELSNEARLALFKSAGISGARPLAFCRCLCATAMIGYSLFKSLFMSNTPHPPQIEIFKPGTFTSVEGEAMTFTSADMVELAESYDAATNPAPLVIGHPGMADPAYGWVKGLSVVGDVLIAETEKVESSFAESVNDGRYKKISARLYPRDHPANPTPGKLHIQHVGFFGAHAVAVKGLKPASFSEAQQVGCMTFEHPHNTPGKQLEEADLAQDEKDGLSFAEAQSALAVERAQFAKDKAAFAETQKIAAKEASDARHAANLSFAEGVVGAGKLAPHAKDELVHVLDQLAVPDVLSFGEGDKAKSPLAIVRGWFDKAGTLVSFAEVAKDDGFVGGGAADPVETGEAARALVRETNAKGGSMSFAEGVRQVKGRRAA
jgi:hypothetical protein